MIIKNKILLLSVLIAIFASTSFTSGSNSGGGNGWFYHMTLFSSFITILVVLLFFVLKMRILHYFVVGFLALQFIASTIIIGLLFSEIEARFQTTSIIIITVILVLRAVAVYLIATCVVPQNSSTTK
jgi:hypothetical protein